MCVCFFLINVGFQVTLIIKLKISNCKNERGCVGGHVVPAAREINAVASGFQQRAPCYLSRSVFDQQNNTKFGVFFSLGMKTTIVYMNKMLRFHDYILRCGFMEAGSLNLLSLLYFRARSCLCQYPCEPDWQLWMGLSEYRGFNSCSFHASLRWEQLLVGRGPYYIGVFLKHASLVLLRNIFFVIICYQTPAGMCRGSAVDSV